MATHFSAWCEDCQVEGPTIRHNGSGVYFWPKAPDEVRGVRVAGCKEWEAFLDEHVYHDIRLCIGGHDSAPMPEQYVGVLACRVRDSGIYPYLRREDGSTVVFSDSAKVRVTVLPLMDGLSEARVDEVVQQWEALDKDERDAVLRRLNAPSLPQRAIHAMPNDRGVHPCCGMHTNELPEASSWTNDQKVVTCDG